MGDGRGLSRRGLLRAGAAGVMAATAGCSGLLGSSPDPLEDDEEEYTLTVLLEEAGSGEPAMEASVSVESEQFVPQADAQVPESDGVVSFELEDGDYVVLVESQEYTNAEEPVSIEGEDVEMTITLERGYG